jgi:hypothetical protein
MPKMDQQSSPSPETHALRRFMRARPVTSLVGGVALAATSTGFVGEVLTSQLGFNEIYVVAAAAALWGFALIGFGLWLRNHHGGFAVFFGFIALICALLFLAMYVARPDLFSAG